MGDEMLANISCETVKPFCFLSQFGPYVQKLCPVSCGLCDSPSNDDGNSLATPQVNPRDPSRYRISSINYHAHLLGREMYATLRREKETTDQQDSVSSMTHRNADLNGLSSTIIEKDLKSREMWNYDNQETIPMNKEFVIDVNENDGTDGDTLMMIKGVEVKPGDKIQATCVYNSNDRSENTSFGLSTYDEMCLIGVFVTFKTPSVDEIGQVDFATELNLRSFSCVMDDTNKHTTDVWQGTLNADEDPRNIWYEHPIEETDSCTFAVAPFVSNTITGETRNCPEKDNDHKNMNDLICYGSSEDNNDELIMSDDSIAGYTCEGGKYDQKDSNEAPLYLTKDMCIVEGGGDAYDAYTCKDAQSWLTHEASVLGIEDEIKEFIRTDWWQPKCCRPSNNNTSSDDNEPAPNGIDQINDDGDALVDEKNESSDAQFYGGSIIMPLLTTMVIMVVSIY